MCCEVQSFIHFTRHDPTLLLSVRLAAQTLLSLPQTSWLQIINLAFVLNSPF